ncbi:hypothetical protein EsH8_IV_000010 [Colletotrichum jinshuiense]
MDQFNSTNSGNETFSVPLIRLRGRNATQNVLYNPGGPGGSGMGAMYSMGDKLHDIMGEGFHVLSFDPRGINSSRPAANCYPQGEEGTAIRWAHPLIHQAQKEADSLELVAWATNYAKACADTMGDHGRYINTPQTAADMNSILDAVGQRDMLYYGVSYGTVLGQTYAAMYPERSRRVIIDGVVNAFDWYGELTLSDALVDNEKVFDGFLEQCVKAGQGNCTLAAEGLDAAGLRSKLFHFIDEVDQQPLSVYVNSTVYGIITAETILNTAIFRTMYSPKRWPQLADRLSELMAGNHSTFFLDYGLMDNSDLMIAFDFVYGNDGISGPAHWGHGAEEMLSLLRPMWNQSILAHAGSRWYYPKQQWRLPKSHNFSLKKPATTGQSGVQTAHPVLILSTTYDPVTPLISARVAQSAFEGSQLVEVKGDYLYNGTLPGTFSVCSVDRPYFPYIDGRDRIDDLGLEGDSSDLVAYRAQERLAEQWVGPHF